MDGEGHGQIWLIASGDPVRAAWVRRKRCVVTAFFITLDPFWKWSPLVSDKVSRERGVAHRTFPTAPTGPRGLCFCRAAPDPWAVAGGVRGRGFRSGDVQQSQKTSLDGRGHPVLLASSGQGPVCCQRPTMQGHPRRRRILPKSPRARRRTLASCQHFLAAPCCW